MSHRYRHSTALALSLLLISCKGSEPGSDGTEDGGDGVTATANSEASSESAEGVDASSSSNGDGDAGDGDGDTSGDGDGESTTGPMECGNGIVEGNEECDDGPTGSSICSEECKYKTECSGTVWQCGDGIDNDNDGEIDNQDSDCFGPCDDNEGGWKGMIPGQADNCQVDCYFDDDNGNGTDNCKWSFACDPLEPMNPPDETCAYEDVDPADGWGDAAVNGSPNDSTTCEGLFTPMMPGQHPDCWDPDGSLGGANVCGALTPPGCDCFGCCAIPNGACTSDADCEGVGVCDLDNNLCVYTVYLGSQNEGGPNDPGSCNFAELKNPTNCHPCTQVQACLNECVNEECELCFGQDPADLPDDCFGQDCDEGFEPCETVADCPEPIGSWACIAGCCAPTPP